MRMKEKRIAQEREKGLAFFEKSAGVLNSPGDKEIRSQLFKLRQDRRVTTSPIE